MADLLSSNYHQVETYGRFYGCVSHSRTDSEDGLQSTVTVYWYGEGVTQGGGSNLIPGPYTTSDDCNLYSTIYYNGADHWSSNIPCTANNRGGYAQVGSYTWVQSSNQGTYKQSVTFNRDTTKKKYWVGLQYDGGSTTYSATLYIPALDTYTITYSAGSISGVSGLPADQTKYHGKIAYVSTSKPKRTGYDFSRWKSINRSPIVYYVSGEDIGYNGDQTFVAEWTACTKTFVFHGNESTSGSMAANQVITYSGSGSTNLNTNQFSRSGYYFTGWNTKADGTGTAYSQGASITHSAITSTATIDLYAQWALCKRTFQFNGNGSTSGSMANQVITYSGSGSTNLNTNTFIKTNYKFIGWNTAANGSGTAYAENAPITRSGITSNSTITLYAQWELAVGHVKYNISNRNGGNITSNFNGETGGPWTSTFTGKDVTINQSYTLASNNLTRSGYVANGWSTTSAKANAGTKDYDNAQVITITSSELNLYNCWQGRQYTIKFNKGEGADVNSAMTDQVVTYGKSFTLKNNTHTKTGYNFNYWTSSNGGTTYNNGATIANGDILTPTQDNQNVTLTASWIAKTFDLSYNVNVPTGVVYNSINSSTIAYNTKYTLTQLPTPNITSTGVWESTHSFIGWMDNDGNIVTTNTTFNRLSNTTLTAQWQETKRLPEFEETQIKVYRFDTQENIPSVVGNDMKVELLIKPGQILTEGNWVNTSSGTLTIKWKLSTDSNYSDNNSKTYDNLDFTNLDSNGYYNFIEVIDSEQSINLEQKRYDIQITINDNAGTKTVYSFINAGSLLLDGFKDSEFKIIASRENEGRKVWFRNDSSDGQAVFLAATNNQPGDYIFTKASSNWTLNGTTVNIYSNYGLDYNNTTLALEVGETITVHSPGNNYIQVALGGAADNKFYNTPINKAAVKLYGDTYIQNSLHVGNPTDAVTSGYFNGNLEITRTNDNNNDAYVSVEKKNNLGTSISKVTLNSCSNGRHGIFSNTKNQWLVYGDTNGTHIGDASEHTISSNLSKIFLGTTSILDIFYPIGSYYETSDANFNPNTVWGGTWYREIQGQVHISAGSNYTVSGTDTTSTDSGETRVGTNRGGATSVSYTPSGTNADKTVSVSGTVGSHTLTTDEIPSHSHSISFYYGGVGKANAPQRGYYEDTEAKSVSTSSAGGGKGHSHTFSGSSTAHTHTFTGTAKNINVMQPYIAVYRWHRTA